MLDRELACAPLDSPEGKEYLAAMCASANYAWANRQMITFLVRRTLAEFFGKKAEELGKPGLVDIRAKQDVFLFTVESTGVLRPEEIVVHALNVLQRKLNVTKGELDILKKQEEERYGDRM